MAHKTFISYKYRDVVEDKEYYNLRDRKDSVKRNIYRAFDTA